MRVRTRPKASAVPSTVATTIVTRAISMLAMSELRSDSDWKNVSYQRRLKPSKFCSDLLELNENRITRKIGANRTRKKRPVKNLRKRGRSKPFGGLFGGAGLARSRVVGLRWGGSVRVDRAHASSSLASRAAERR